MPTTTQARNISKPGKAVRAELGERVDGHRRDRASPPARPGAAPPAAARRSASASGPHQPERRAPAASAATHRRHATPAAHVRAQRTRRGSDADQRVVLAVLQRVDRVVADHPEDRAGIERSQHRERSAAQRGPADQRAPGEDQPEPRLRPPGDPLHERDRRRPARGCASATICAVEPQLEQHDQPDAGTAPAARPTRALSADPPARQRPAGGARDLAVEIAHRRCRCRRSPRRASRSRRAAATAPAATARRAARQRTRPRRRARTAATSRSAGRTARAARGRADLRAAARPARDARCRGRSRVHGARCFIARRRKSRLTTSCRALCPPPPPGRPRSAPRLFVASPLAEGATLRDRGQTRRTTSPR